MKEWGCGDLIPVCTLPLTQVWTPMGTALLLLIFLKGMHLEIQRQENVFLLWEEGSIGSSGIRGGKRDESSVKNAKQTTQALSILRPPSSPKCLRWEEEEKKKKSLSNWQSQNRKERSSSGGRGQAGKQAHNNGLLGDYNKFIIMDGTKSKQPEVCAWFNDSGAMHSGEL